MLDSDVFSPSSVYSLSYEFRVNELRDRTGLEVWDLYNKNKFEKGFVEWLSYLFNTQRRALVDACETVLKERIKNFTSLDSKILGNGRSRERS